MKTLALAVVLALAPGSARADPLADAAKKPVDRFRKSADTQTGERAQVRRIEIPRDMIGGPSPDPGGSLSAGDPKVKALLAAVDYVASDDARDKAKEAFGRYLERPGSAGGTVGPGDAEFAAAKRLIRSLVLAPASDPRRINVGKTSARAGGAAGWNLTPFTEGAPFPGGDVDFAEPPRDQIGQSGPSDRNFYRLRKIDDWANAVLHETLHIYHDAFVFAGFKSKRTTDEPPICFGQTIFGMGASPTLVCANNACPQPYGSYFDAASRTSKKCYRPCADSVGRSCFSWATPGRDATGPTEIVARQLSLDLTEASRGDALKKIVDAVR